jgi:hypothetical protein
MHNDSAAAVLLGVSIGFVLATCMLRAYHRGRLSGAEEATAHVATFTRGVRKGRAQACALRMEAAHG